MEAIVDAEVNEGKNDVESEVGNNCGSDPVVYQLVRVEGDGTLVPATEDDVMQFEHLLEDEKSEPPSVEGLAQSKNTELESTKLDTRLEEEKLQSSSESLDLSANPPGDQTSDCANNAQEQKNELQSENALMETTPISTILNGSHSGEMEKENMETCAEPANEAVTSISSVSKTCISSMPDFSLIKGEVCLDKFTIRELQEAFRATFGRQTSVKDKLWLKRRIAMGLTNSCDVPSSHFVIKDNQIVHEEAKEETPCSVSRSKVEAGSPSGDQGTEPTKDGCQDSAASSYDHIKDLELSGKRLSRPTDEYDETKENLGMEEYSVKRMRKPTRRYIEELSDFETQECVARVPIFRKNSGHVLASPKPWIRSVRESGAQSTTYSTRQDSIGGFNVRVPYVSRVRRGRPRKNFMTLMQSFHPSGMASNFVKPPLEIFLRQNVESRNKIRKARSLPMRIPQLSIVDKKRDTENAQKPDSEEESCMDTFKFDTAEENTNDNADARPALKGGPKRKHHRAWTLCEVLKLVEGVAKFGAGRWSEIRRLAFASYSYRTSVDLKDKWRNLLRASLSQVPNEKEDKFSRKHTSIPIPTPILLRVRELAEMHSQTGIEIKPSKFSGHSGKIVQGSGSGFL
ncbi:uncharacterized protein LOC109704962 isoform X3 [Ananas comosus]|uniref:Uncharacterized protein LOC109704962 isoform X3 n=1 Tax=Ananas comosus TaxID=4615 RepID=A0A6P5EDK8_ANACO|nr:uncharacterized protein LOC109704962 isoform X3 [Ananas comosus]